MTTLKVPKGAEEDYLWLLFKAIDGAAEIWIDGQSAGKLPGDPWDKPKAIDISKVAKAGREQRVVIRVVKDLYAAGIFGQVRLMQAYKRIGDK